MIPLIPTRKAVSETWDAYAALCQAAAKDPLIATDDAFILARDRAHKRWTDAFVSWDGK